MARGNIDYDQIRDAARRGSGQQFQMAAGVSPTAGDLAAFDAQGNVIDAGHGLYTSPFGVLILWLAGTLSVGSDLIPVPVQFPPTRSMSPVGLVATVKVAPTGDSITFSIRVNGVAWISLSIAAGTTSVVATAGQISAAGPIPAGALISLDLQAVGSTVSGSGLSILVYA